MIDYKQPTHWKFWVGSSVGVVTAWIKGVPLNGYQASSTIEGQLFPFHPKYKMGNVDLTINKMYQMG